MPCACRCQAHSHSALHATIFRKLAWCSMIILALFWACPGSPIWRNLNKLMRRCTRLVAVNRPTSRCDCALQAGTRLHFAVAVMFVETHSRCCLHCQHIHLDECLGCCARFSGVVDSCHTWLPCTVQDVVMPEGGDGLDLLESVQANPEWRNIPVVSAQPAACCWALYVIMQAVLCTADCLLGFAQADAQHKIGQVLTSECSCSPKRVVRLKEQLEFAHLQCCVCSDVSQ